MERFDGGDNSSIFFYCYFFFLFISATTGTETFMFKKPFQLLNKVETYMQVVQDAMTDSLEDLMIKSAARYATLKKDDVRTVGR